MDYPPTYFGGIAGELYYVEIHLAKNTLGRYFNVSENVRMDS